MAYRLYSSYAWRLVRHLRDQTMLQRYRALGKQAALLHHYDFEGGLRLDTTSLGVSGLFVFCLFGFVFVLRLGFCVVPLRLLYLFVTRY